jgi:hypothetical protein
MDRSNQRQVDVVRMFAAPEGKHRTGKGAGLSNRKAAETRGREKESLGFGLGNPRAAPAPASPYEKRQK